MNEYNGVTCAIKVVVHVRTGTPHRDGRIYNIGQIACCSLVRAIRFCARAQTRRVDQFHGRIIGIVHPFVSPTYEYTRQRGRDKVMGAKRRVE